MRDFTRQQWLQLRPETYLADGWLDAQGRLIPDFTGDYATAAATQLMAAECSPQELALTYEGIRQLLPVHEGPPRDRLFAAFEETLLVVARAIRQPNNGGLVDWISDCAAIVETQAELEGFMRHIQAVMRLYAIMVAAMPDDSSSASRPVS